MRFKKNLILTNKTTSLKDTAIKNIFASHIIIKREIPADKSAGYYLVMGEKGSEFWFQVTFAPKLIVLSGDMGICHR